MMFKKSACFFFAMIFAVISSGCSPDAPPEASGKPSGEPPTLTVFVDGMDYSSSDIKGFLRDIPGYGEDFQAEIHFIAEGREEAKEIREGANQNARLELASGGGADVYIAKCTRGIDMENLVKGTFTYPRSAMDQGYFEPLDQYLENARFMDWESLWPQVMEAGKNRDGQVLIPLTFSINATLFDSKKYERPDSLPATCEAQISSSDWGMKSAAKGAPFAFSDRLGALIDYSADTLTFTEEELQQSVEDYLSVDSQEMLAQGESIGYIEPSVEIGPDEIGRFPDKKTGGKQQNYTMLPTCNRTGGVTAYITSFAAVNRNTEYPEYAFSIVDRLAAKDVQQELIFGRGMPVCRDLGGKDAPLGISQWALTEENFEQYRWLCEQISEVEFRTELNLLISQMMYDCTAEPDAQKRKDIVSKAYSEMKMIAGEI